MMPGLNTVIPDAAGDPGPDVCVTLSTIVSPTGPGSADYVLGRDDSV